VRLGLTARILIGGGIVAVVFLVQFLFTTGSFRSIRHDTREEQRADATVVAAGSLENSILSLQTATRGYVLTSDPRFREQYVLARKKLPGQSKLLMTLEPGTWATTLDRQWRSYIRDWTAPLLALTARSPAQARARFASGEDAQRVDRMRALIDPFVARRDAVAEADRARVSHAVTSGMNAGFIGAFIRALVFVAIIAYLLRFAVAPIRRIAGATERIADGDLGVKVPEQGPGEIGQLARSFNKMAASLERQQRDLASQNVDLERLANVLRAVLDSTIDGILLSDSDGNIQLANRPVLNLTRELGMRYDGPVVDRLLSVEHRIKDRDRYHAAMERLRTNPDEETFDEFEDAVSGRAFQGFTAPVRDDRGGFLGRIWTLREVTQQRELDRLKDDFVATVSHELRTPLTSMMGFLEMIREGEAGQLTDEQKRFLAIVYRSSERLQRLVGDLLFVARLDASGLQLHFAPVRLDEIAREVVESSAALARSREIELDFEVADVPSVLGDQERLLQLVGNLLSNALKFTPAGGTVTVRVFAEGGGAVLEVADTGIGIPADEQDRLFQRFFRSSTATQQAIPGTGLGLVISRAIAEAHGGTIDVTSQVGAGTRFRVELPAQRDEAVE
jgi:signal transduction histidine kinase